MAKSKEILENHKNNANSIKNSEYHFANQEQKDRYDNKVSSFVNSLSDKQKEVAVRASKCRKAQNDYSEYIQYINPTYKMTKFHKFLCNVCDGAVKRIENNQKDLANARRTFICLSVPPQLGKSITVTKTLPSWFVGRNPDLSAILVAYNGDYAVRFSDANRQNTREFGKEVFGIEISETQDTKDRYEIKGHKGFVYGAGINAGITGNGCELLIIDDPYKNSNEANSKTYRESISNVFKDSCLTRLHAGGVCIVIHTRWHEEDLIAELSKQDNTIVINLPLVCENEETDPLHREKGQTLCPELGFGSIYVEETKARVGLKVFNALYQGKPSIEGGEIFKRDTVKFYTRATLPNVFDEQCISCDLSFGGIKKANDPCAIQVWGRVGSNHYLLKRIKKRLTFVEMCEMIRIVSAEYPLARKKIVEKKANGQAVIDSLNNEIGGFEAYDPKMTDKVGRANAITPYFDSGNVFLPSVDIDRNIDEFVEELLKFPNSEHDDEVDAMTQYLNVWQYKTSGRLLKDDGYLGIANAWKGLKVW